MGSPDVDTILEQVKGLPPEQQVEVAQAIDRLTWARRWRATCERIEAQSHRSAAVSDEEIDAAVRTVRKEKPLSERSSTHPS